MYLGPSLSRGRLNMYATFREGKVPPYLEDLFAQYPDEFDLLFVPISGVRDTNRKIQTIGTPEKNAYETLKGV